MSATTGGYQGALTPPWSRFLILPRYAAKDVFDSRLFVAFYALCFLLPFAGLLTIYLHHNLAALQFLDLPLQELARRCCRSTPPSSASGIEFQGWLCFFLALFVGPALVAPDLRNNGLPLYLSRPFSRTEYVLGKMTVLAALMSLITWVPGLLLFFFQGYLEGAGWLSEQSADRVGDLRRQLDLDPGDLPDLARHLGLGEVEAGRAGVAAARLLHARGLRQGDQREARHLVGVAGLAAGRHVPRLVAPVRPGDRRGPHLRRPGRPGSPSSSAAWSPSGCSPGASAPMRWSDDLAENDRRPRRSSRTSRSSTATCWGSTGSTCRSRRASPAWWGRTARARRR